MKTQTRKEEIIKTAAKLFKDKGYSAVTMRDLASEMGIKAASLYNHINSKQDILNEVIISIAEEFTNGMKLIQSTDDSRIDKLKKIIQLHVKISSDNIYGMASLNNDWMHLGDQLDYYQKLRIDYESDFMSILKNGIAAGEIIEAKPDVMMFSILTTLRSLYLWIPKKEILSLEDLSRNLTQVLVEGINK
jgi:AcrR family transcriptional regulator